MCIRDRSETITNEEVFKRAQEVKTFLRNLKGRRAKFIEHILRHNGLLKRIIEGTIEGKNHRGRPRLDYMKPVSYTHLDVYKRQLIIVPCFI